MDTTTTAPADALVKMPNEVLVEIFKQIDRHDDRASFLMSNRLTYALLVGDFHRRAIQEENQALTDKITALLLDDDVQGLRRLLNRGVNPNSNIDSNPLLFWAAALHAVDCFKTLVARGGDFKCQGTVITPTGTYVENLLHTVCASYCQPWIYSGTESGAAQLKLLEIARFLIELGADVDALKSEGTPTLHGAVTVDTRLLQLLIDHGANINAVDRTGQTALHVSIRHSRGIRVVRTLLQYGAKVDAIDNSGNSPLRYALSREGVIPLLLQFGASKFTGVPGKILWSAVKRDVLAPNSLSTRALAFTPDCFT